MTGPCVNPDQFYLDSEGRIMPQPWMQMRSVAHVEAEPSSVEYDSSGGGNKDDLVHKLVATYTNETPVVQHIFGRITSGGMEVALQARSRGYLEYRHGYAMEDDYVPGDAIPTLPMQPVSRFGGGADIGQGGVLAIGTGFCVHDTRCPSHTIPFMPHVTGWFPVNPGETIHAGVELWFKSEFWENSMIDGGDQGTESYFRQAGTAIDLFACPSVDPPVVRSTPTVVGATFDIDSPDGEAHIDKPVGTAEDDTMVAVLAAIGGNHSAMTAPDDSWAMLIDRDQGPGKLHLKVFTKLAGAAEPSSYQFGVPSGAGTEGMIQIVTVRGVDYEEGFDAELRYTAPSGLFAKGKRQTPLPSIVSYRKLMLAFSFLSHSITQGQVEQEEPPGMIALTSDEGDITSLALAYQLNQPNPTGERDFVASEAIRTGQGRISGVITLSGNVVPLEA